MSRLLILLAVLTATADALMLPHHGATRSSLVVPQQPPMRQSLARTGKSSLQMAGFGGGGGGASKKGGKKDNTKLKPKAQWDRYKDLKDEEAVRVAVRCVNSKKRQWYQIGAIKSQKNAYTEAAVLRHKVLIAEHARRMFPVQISSPKDRLEWAYCSSTATQDDDWVILDSDAVVFEPEGIEKQSGFEGLADPTGLYAIRTVKNVDVA